MEKEFMNQIKNLQQNINIQEAISTITELTIFGDQKNQDLFDLFIEQRIIDEFLKLLKTTINQELIITIIQQVSMLLTNINKNLIVLLSLPQLNEFIIFDYNLQKEEISDYYINFIKVISNKLNPKNISLFFNSKYCQFPLLLYSQNFYNSKDNLTRIYTRHLLLQILKTTLESKLQPILLNYLQSYPFLQVLTNHVQFMKNLILKSKEKDDIYDEEIRLMDYFFTDLTKIVPKLKYILDNLFVQIIILPHYKDLKIIDDNQKTLCFKIISHFLQNPIYVSEKLTFGIFNLIFSHEIPQIQIFEFEENYLPVQDADLKTICSKFFEDSQQQQESQQLFWEKINQSLFFIPFIQTTQVVKINSKKIFFEELLQNDFISNLFMSNNINQINSFQYNTYNIFAQLDCLNNMHYYQVLNILDILLMNKHIYQMTIGQKVTFFINLINIMINEQKLNTIENCKKTIQIIKELLSENEKQFTIAYLKSNLLNKMETHFVMSESLYYKYFYKIQQCIEDENIQIFNNKPETHQIIRFLMVLNVIFEKGWLVNQFKQPNYKIDIEHMSYKNDLIKLVNCQLIIDNVNYDIEELEVDQDEKENQIIIVNLLDENKTQKFQFDEKNEQEDFQREFQRRQKLQEQHFIPEILTQINKLYQ